MDLDLEAHDYQIYYVNNNLHHQYGISAADEQMSLFLANVPRGERSKERSLFSRLWNNGLSHLLLPS